MEKIVSRKNEKIKRLRKLVEDRAYRRSEGEFVSDGEKMLAEAVQSGMDVRLLLVREGADVCVPDGVEAYCVPEDVLESVSPLKTARDVIFSCAIPAAEPKEFDVRGGAVLLENLQDPGNVGTVIRTANAFGMDDVFLLGSCADVWGPRTVRAAMGGLFRQRVTEITYEDVERLKAHGARLIGAALGEGSRDIGEVPLNGAVVAIGSEGSGLTDRLKAMCDSLVIIPMEERCESLNASAAAAVVMWEMRKARLGSG